MGINWEAWEEKHYIPIEVYFKFISTYNNSSYRGFCKPENIIRCFFLNSSPTERQFCQDGDIMLSRTVDKPWECSSEVEGLHSVHKALVSTPRTTKVGRGIKRTTFTSNRHSINKYEKPLKVHLNCQWENTVLSWPTKMANFCGSVGRKTTSTRVIIYELQLFILTFLLKTIVFRIESYCYWTKITNKSYVEVQNSDFSVSLCKTFR